jgi:S-adenosylmethionine decarboxylase
MQGWHLTAELYDCVATSAEGADLMRDIAALRTLCRHSVAASGLHAVGELFHPFPAPGGITGVVLLAESHVAVHTWPEQRAVTLDVYVCNHSSDNAAAAQSLMDTLVQAFAPVRSARQRWPRGGVDVLG